MKKLMLLLVLALIGAVYAIGAFNLSDTGAGRFLDELEQFTVQGDAPGYCARLHDDLEVSIQDHSATPPADFNGDRAQYCGYVTGALKGVDLLGISMKVTRDDFTVTRSW